MADLALFAGDMQHSINVLRYDLIEDIVFVRLDPATIVEGHVTSVLRVNEHAPGI